MNEWKWRLNAVFKYLRISAGSCWKMFFNLRNTTSSLFCQHQRIFVLKNFVDTPTARYSFMLHMYINSNLFHCPWCYSWCVESETFRFYETINWPLNSPFRALTFVIFPLVLNIFVIFSLVLNIFVVLLHMSNIFVIFAHVSNICSKLEVLLLAPNPILLSGLVRRSRRHR